MSSGEPKRGVMNRAKSVFLWRGGSPENYQGRQAAEMPKSKRGRPPKYNALEICERSIKIIKALGVADCTKTAVAVAFYDPKFDPTKPGEKERLLTIGDKQGESAIARQRRRAKRISQRVSYLELLETNHCPEFEQLVAAVDRGMSGMSLGTWLVSWIGTKKSGREIPPHYLLTNQQVSKKKKARK